MAFMAGKRKAWKAQCSGISEENVALNQMDRCRKISTVVQPSFTACPATAASIERKRSVFRRTETWTSLERTLQNFQATDSAKKILRTRLQCSSLAACIMGTLAAVLAIVDIELVTHAEKFKNSTDLIEARNISSYILSSEDTFVEEKLSLASTGIKCVISVLSILTCVAIYVTYSTQLRLHVVKHTYPETDSLSTASFFPKYLLEIAVSLFHVPPLAVQYGFHYRFQLFVVLRLYLVLRYVKEHNRFTNSKSTGILASVTKTDISPIFLVKMYFMKLPFRLIFIFYSLNVFLGGYIVYILEDSHSYLDTIWMLVVTMTTLGFGDVVPVSVMARAIVGFASVLGIFLMALFISVVHENLQLSQHEKRILAYIENAEHTFAVKMTAAQCIQTYWRFSSFVGKNRAALNRGALVQTQKYKLLQHKLFKQIRSWRQIRQRSSRDDYWRKFFVAEDTAMLLTDVSRSVETIANTLQRTCNLRSNRSSLRKVSSTTNIGNQPPSIFEEPEPLVMENKLNKTEPFEFGSMQLESSANKMPYIGKISPQPLTTPKASLVHRNFSNDESARLTFENPKLLPRETNLTVSVDHIDKGTIAVESIQQRLDSLEKSVDQILVKVKSELRDVQEAIKNIDFPRSPYFLGPSPSTSPNVGQNSVPNGKPVFTYPHPLTNYNV